MSAHTLHDTQSCFPVLQYLLHNSLLPFLPTQCQVSYVIFRNRKNFYFRQPLKASWNQVNQSSTHVQHENAIEQMLDCVKTSLVEDLRVSSRDCPRGVVGFERSRSPYPWLWNRGGERPRVSSV
jgi:hypothetical protein